MEAKMDKLLATLDRAVKIEMMKLPQSLHTTLIKDIMSGKFTITTFRLKYIYIYMQSLKSPNEHGCVPAQETSVGEVTMAIGVSLCEMSPSRGQFVRQQFVFFAHNLYNLYNYLFFHIFSQSVSPEISKPLSRKPSKRGDCLYLKKKLNLSMGCCVDK